MASPRVDSKKQVTYTNGETVLQRTVPKTATPILSFKRPQGSTGLQLEHYAKSNQGYVQSYVRVKSKDGKTYNFNKILEKRINNVTAKLQKAEKENGLIGKAWSWTKNTIGFGNSSNKVRELQENERKLLAQFNSNEQTRAKVFKQLTGYEYTEENLEKFIKGQIKLKSEIAIEKYKTGQKTAVDITSDIISGIAAYGAAAACIAGGIAAAPFTAGASLGAIAVGIGIAAGVGAATKVAIKGGEAAVGGKKYSLKQARKDAIIGAVSGGLAPVTLGIGGAITKSLGKGFAATSIRFASEGATFGFADGTTRSALEGNSLGDVALDGLKGAGIGMLAGNILGHSGNALGKIVTKNVHTNGGANTSKSLYTHPNTIKTAENKLIGVLRSDNCPMPDYMALIPKNANKENTIRFLEQLFEESKFFSRVSTCELQYGKNFAFARMMSKLSKEAQISISEGKSFEDVLNKIAKGYSQETTINTELTNRIGKSGIYRGDANKPPKIVKGWGRIDKYITGYGCYGAKGGYREYVERLNANLNKKTSPYENFTLTKGFDETMVHPYHEEVAKNMEIISERYKVFQNLVKEYQKTGVLNTEQRKQADKIISEIYYLMANTCPFHRGSNGISDVLMRSQYAALGINKPHVKQGVGLDLEAFCMNLDEYITKWNSFFEL